MRIVVTGATGNIGSAVLRALDGRGHAVHGIARRPLPASRSVTWSRLDLSDDGCVPELQSVVAGADAVVNLAWAFQPMRRRDYLHRASVGILERVARATLANSDARLVHLSSVAVYSPRASTALVDEEWPRDGIPGATYSRLKVQAERALHVVAASARARDRVSVVRPSLVGQRAAGGMMLRCGAPAAFPAGALRRVPVSPVDDRFGIQMVHADDVADVVVRILEREAAGAFNVAAEPVLSGHDIAAALCARPVRLRQEVVSAAAAAVWLAHLSPLDPGWVDMALQAPWVDSSRARDVLGWSCEHDAHEVLAELVEGMRQGAGAGGCALRPRHVADGLLTAGRRGSVARRRLT
ncbi:NAD-dependent epimerase/dehydratase family protein [Terrabacter sp. NPDC080008]|uniref:NAD-dependent epimerase/dehydratase family protein n=1 Tax=Terrabacter sp. NPDC080008 TaxID=3155176 RepID=UPI00344E2E0A